MALDQEDPLLICSLSDHYKSNARNSNSFYLAFVDLTRAFDLVSRTGLFKLLEKIGCPPKLLSIIASFHVNMHGTVNFDGVISEPF